MYVVYEFLKMLSHSKHSFVYPICHFTHTHTLTHSGGIELIFNGTNLDVVQNPMLVISDPEYLDVSNVSQSQNTKHSLLANITY